MIHKGYLSGHTRWIYLEKEFWVALELIAATENKTLTDLFNAINKVKQRNTTLASAAKIFVINYLIFEKVHTNDASKISQNISHSTSGYEIVQKKIVGIKDN